MSDIVTPAEKAPATAPKERAAAGPKVWKYVGPKPAALISNLPGTGQKYRADDLPQEHIQFVLDTVPGAKDWWV